MQEEKVPKTNTGKPLQNKVTLLISGAGLLLVAAVVSISF